VNQSRPVRLLESETPRRLASGGCSAPRPRRTAAGGSGRGGVAGHLRCGDPGDRPQPGLEPHRAAGCRQPDRALLAEHCKHRRPARGGGRRPRRLRLGVLAGERRHAEWLAVPCRCSGRLDTVGGSDDRHHLRRLGQRGFALRGQLPGDHAHAAPGDLWAVRAANPSTDPNPYNGVQAGLAVGNLQGGEDVVAGSLGRTSTP